MVFLKKFHAEGFKSFAKPTTINFDHNMTSIIGPNGSGKSNIVDALKWTIGEQSIKQLRGSDKTNLIFMGSENLSESDFALVELTFDNKSRVLHKDLDEIKITRKLIRKTGESIYLLNDEPAKLREIQEIFLDTGLSKGSLGIISQGTVNWFSDCKPEERRKIFEDASGIGRYTKRKHESLKALETAKLNLEFVSKKVSDIQRDINKLSNQANKLRDYQEKTARLKEIDLTVKAKEYTISKSRFTEQKTLSEKLAKDKETTESNITHYNSLIKQKNELFDKNKIEIDRLTEIKEELNNKLLAINSKINIHKQNLNNALYSNNIEDKIRSYKEIIKNNEIVIKSSEERKVVLEQKISDINIDLSRLQLEIESLNSQSKILNDELVIKKRDLETLNRDAEFHNSDKCINTIMSNKNLFPGIIGTLVETINVKSKYETAIATALGSAAKNVISLNEHSAIQAIKFAKENRLGYLTFLPLDKIVAKSVPSEILNAVKEIKGFIDIASNLVTVDNDYKKAIEFVLGNILIVDDIQNASLISDITKQRIKIVTLDGNVKNVGGSLSGGFKHKSNVIFNIKEKIEILQNEVNEKNEKYRNILLEIENLKTELNNYLEVKRINELDLNATSSKLKETLENNETSKYEYELLVSKHKNINIIDDKQSEENLTSQAIDVENKLKDILAELNSKIKTNENLYSEIRSFSSENENYVSYLQGINAQISDASQEIFKLENKIKAIEHECIETYHTSLDILESDYLNKDIGMSDLDAKKMVTILQSEIKALGPINETVLEDLENKQKEYENINNEYEDSLKAFDEIQKIIEELDKKAISDFMNVINNVNKHIPAIFNELFGGGYCEIKLTNPDEILESGIDIIVQPKGKKVKNLTLLSGGEKTLVALTVLFAILNSSNLPLIVLDEAEAALDELNVEIFAKIIKKYSEKTQFLVITHRPGTMKESSVLYGVTMQDKGVSIVMKTSFDKINFKELE